MSGRNRPELDISAARARCEAATPGLGKFTALLHGKNADNDNQFIWHALDDLSLALDAIAEKDAEIAANLALWDADVKDKDEEIARLKEDIASEVRNAAFESEHAQSALDSMRQAQLERDNYASQLALSTKWLTPELDISAAQDINTEASLAINPKRGFMQITIEQTAVAVAALLKRANTKRARISEKTIRFLSKRKNLRVAFLSELSIALDDLGVHMIELERGGFGLIPISALNGAPTILAKTYLSDDLQKLRSGDAKTFQKLRIEISEDDEVDKDDEA